MRYTPTRRISAAVLLTVALMLCSLATVSAPPLLAEGIPNEPPIRIVPTDTTTTTAQSAVVDPAGLSFLDMLYLLTLSL